MDRIFHCGSVAARCFASSAAPTLDCPYAQPPGAILLKAPMELVVMTCDDCGTLARVLPCSRSARNDMAVYQTEETLTSKVRV